MAAVGCDTLLSAKAIVPWSLSKIPFVSGRLQGRNNCSFGAADAKVVLLMLDARQWNVLSAWGVIVDTYPIDALVPSPE